MTTTEKNQRIAEKCGWIRFFNPTGPEDGEGDWLWHKGNKDVHMPPNYFTDLNAMHEAEKTMKDYHWYPYRVRLDKWSMIKERGYIGSIHATAAQRAEAFGLTLGLWKEGE